MLHALTLAATLTPVLQGARAAAFGAVDYIACTRAEAGGPVAVIVPDPGTLIAPRPIMIRASTPNPDAARAFVDATLPGAGQALVAETFLMLARTVFEGRRPQIDAPNVIQTDEAAASARRKAIIVRFNEVKGR